MIFAEERFNLEQITSITFSFRYNSSSLRFALIQWQFQNKMFVPMKLIKGYLSWFYDVLRWVEPTWRFQAAWEYSVFTLT